MSMSMSMIFVPVTRMLVFVVGMPGYVPGFVFLRSNEIHGPIAGVVLVAVFAPIFCMPWRHVQIDGRRWRCLRLDQHRLRIYERRRRCITNLNLPVYARRDVTR